MRLVHLSDVHLGYRQYQRLTPGGVNQREADVATTFRTAIDQIIGLQPELIVVAGDVFHTVRPSNRAILHAFLQFSRLVQSLPGTKVVLVAGNHDAPRSTEAGGILQLFAQLGIEVVDTDARHIRFPDLDVSVLAVPGITGIERPRLAPDPNARYNVLTFHGGVEGALPEGPDRAAFEVPYRELRAAQWSYVALGHYHVYREVASNAYYSGSIDHTSLDMWGDLREERDANIAGKGFIERDLETGDHTFHVIPGTRVLIDLMPIDARGLTAAEVSDRIRGAVESWPGGIDDKIVRLRVREITRSIVRELDHKAIRDYKRRALNFKLDLYPPERRTSVGSGAPGGRRMIDLSDVVREKLTARPLDADIDRAAFIEQAVSYVKEADVAEVAPAALANT